MEEKKVKSGKEIIGSFFNNISSIENVDKTIANSLTELYKNGKLTEKAVINMLQQIREQNDDKN